MVSADLSASSVFSASLECVDGYSNWHSASKLQFDPVAFSERPCAPPASLWARSSAQFATSVCVALVNAKHLYNICTMSAQRRRRALNCKCYKDVFLPHTLVNYSALSWPYYLHHHASQPNPKTRWKNTQVCRVKAWNLCNVIVCSSPPPPPPPYGQTISLFQSQYRNGSAMQAK